MDPIVGKCKLMLKAHYKERFGGLVCYGSTVRNNACPGSDIDLLVLLSPPFDYFRELRAIADILYPAQLESDRLISAKPAASDDYEEGTIQLYRNARKEGIAV